LKRTGCKLVKGTGTGTHSADQRKVLDQYVPYGLHYPDQFSAVQLQFSVGTYLGSKTKVFSQQFEELKRQLSQSKMLKTVARYIIIKGTTVQKIIVAENQKRVSIYTVSSRSSRFRSQYVCEGVFHVKIWCVEGCKLHHFGHGI
jgi:hypothetical protein